MIYSRKDYSSFKCALLQKNQFFLFPEKSEETEIDPLEWGELNKVDYQKRKLQY